MFSVRKGLKCVVPGVSGCFSVHSALCTFDHLFQFALEMCCLGKQCVRKPKGAVGSKEVRWELACGVGLPSAGGGAVLCPAVQAPTPQGVDGEGVSRQEKSPFIQLFYTWFDVLGIVSCSC